jgi:hypothetical protein
MNLLRWILRSHPAVTRDKAIELARAHCEKEGLPWVEPVVVTERWREYVVRTNTEMRGGNVVIKINNSDGRVIRSGVSPL